MPISEVLSEALQTPIEELPPLAESIDLEALSALVTDESSHDVTVTFTYAGLRVFIHSDSMIYAVPIHAERTDPVKNTYR